MKNLSVAIIIVVIIALISSCFPKPLEIEMPVYEPKLVVSSQFDSDSGIYVTITRSFSALNDNYKIEKINIDFIQRVFVFHALVTIGHDGIVDTLKYLGPGLFGNPEIPVTDFTEYNLYIYDSTTNITVVSKATALPNVSFDTVYPVLIKNQNDTNAVIHYSFTDLPGSNYYMVNYFKQEPDTALQNLLNFDPEDPFAQMLLDSLGYDDIFETLSKFSTIGNNSTTTNLFEDIGFTNELHSDSVVFNNINTTDTLVISIGNISYEYYYYLLLRQKASSLFSQIMSEPINMPSNIDTGYGMFTAHKQEFKFIMLGEYR